MEMTEKNTYFTSVCNACGHLRGGLQKLAKKQKTKNKKELDTFKWGSQR